MTAKVWSAIGLAMIVVLSASMRVNAAEKESSEDKVGWLVKSLGGGIRGGPTGGGKSITWINVVGSDVDDADLRLFGNLRDLEFLDISITKITADGLKHISHLPKLNDLRANSTSLDNRAFDSIKEMKALKSLQLGATFVSLDGLKSLTDLPNLELLRLTDTGVDDNALAQIVRCGKLRQLALRRTKITDVGLKSLKRMSHLQRLDIRDTKITNEGLQYLGEVESLRRISLKGAGVTDEGIDLLQSVRPDIEVFR